MEKRGLGPAVLRFVRNIGIGIGCIFFLAALSCLPAAWRTFYHLGNRVMLLGGIALLVGMISPMGRLSASADSLNVLPMGRSSEQRARQQAADAIGSWRFMFAAGLTGGIALLVGGLIRHTGLVALGIR